jgi:prepilin-type N-terminal cleavage/methylation domain-containing protein
MKKGFSMVELAIVLVIIGIIMGMALKGRSVLEAAKIRNEARKLERFELAIAVAVQKLGPKGTVGELETYTAGDNFLSEDIFISENLLNAADYETYTMPYSGNNPQMRKRIYNSRLSREETVANLIIDNADGRQDPGATLVFSAAPYLVCQFEILLDDRDKLTGQGVINRLDFVGTDGVAYGFDDLSNEPGATLDYICLRRWSHNYADGNFGEYFWKLL